MSEKTSHINYAVNPKPHTSMYLMHKYWARKPYNVVSHYIETYTKKGEIVLDPFCGSGPTPIEAIKLGRKGIGIDLNPMAIRITKMTAIPIDITDIENCFNEVIKCSNEIEKLYETKCNCGSKANTLATIWNRDDNLPEEIRYFCVKCNERKAKKPEKEDLDLLNKIEEMKVPFWYPTTKLEYDTQDFKEGTHKAEYDSIDKLFTRRNLISLSIVFNEIQKIKNEKLKLLFEFVFTRISHLASKMCPSADPGGKGHWSEFSATSFWPVHRYWIPPTNMESNVLMLFENAINGVQGIVKGKQDSKEQIKYYRETDNFNDLNKDANFFIKNHNALELNEIIPRNSVDYVFTDPPYGGAIQYFELSTLWASWLKEKLNYEDEITINRKQNKDFKYYHRMLTASFKQIFDVLKRGKYMTVTFHSTQIKVWTSIIKAIVLAGFDLEKIIYQPPARASAKGLLQPYGSATGDYYIRFRKPESQTTLTPAEISQERYERIVIEAAKRIIAERGEPIIYQHILNGIIVELKREGALLSGETNPEDIMKAQVEKEFILIDILDKKGKKLGNKWWLKDPKSIPYLELIPLADRVETAIIDVLRDKVKVSYDDILQKIFIKFPNALTPDTQSIKEILDEYANKTTDGKWRLKPKIKETEGAHSKMIYFLGIIGKKAGFDVWIGIREQSDVYNKVKLSDLITNKSPIFRFIPSLNLDRIKQIDVLWHEDGKIKYEFEVENSTAITEAIVRGSNIPHDDIKRLIIIPKEREKLLFKKLNEPIFKDRLLEYNWQFIYYNDLEKFYNKHKKTEKIVINEFNKLFQIPQKSKKSIQKSLDTFNKT